MVDLLNLKLNKYQTPITQELKDSLHKEVWADLEEYISTVSFIQHMISDETVRGYARDKPRNSNGRITVDLTKPHILEDMDFFREKALFFQKNGKYTNIPVNSNPKSEYAAFWKQELHRWEHGLTRESDGEWIPGELYFYWNYSPIWLVKEDKTNNSNNKKTKGKRVREFPKPWSGDYLFHHYIEQAKANGKHGKLLKCRGIGFSFKCASWSPRNMYIHPGSGNPNFHLASEKSFLQGDKGIFGKVMDCLDWIADNTPFAKLRLMDSKKGMEIQLGYLDDYGVRRGLLSSVFGISLKDNPEKARGIRGPLIHYEEDGLFPNLETAWNVNRKAVEDGDVSFGFMLAGGTGGCVTAGNKVWNNKGELVNIEDLDIKDGIIGFDGTGYSKENITYWQKPTNKECIKITTNTLREIECSTDHPIYTLIKRGRTSNTYDFKAAKDLSIGDTVGVINSVDIFGSTKMWNPRLVGLLIGDGSYGYNNSVSLSNCDVKVLEYVEGNFDTKTSVERPTKCGRIYKELGIRGIRPELRKLGIINQTKNDKTLPHNLQQYTREDVLELIGGFYDADGYVNLRKTSKGRDLLEISLSSSSKSLLEEVRLTLNKFNIHGRIRKRLPKLNKKGPIKDVNSWYEFVIADCRSAVNFVDNITLLCEHKQARLLQIKEVFSTKKPGSRETNFRTEKIISIENVGVKPVYNLTAGNTNTYLVNGIITHNTEGASFEGSEKLFYKADAYNIYSIPNAFDKNVKGTTNCGYFWGAYINRNKCYDESVGESDVIKALIEILQDRFLVKYNSSDPKAITQKKAEECITPQEAVLRVDGTIFPVADLKDYLEDIFPRKESFLAEHYVGDLTYKNDGGIKWTPNPSLYPIRSYSNVPANKRGAVEIFEMPKKNGRGEIASGRYIAGIDPIDADSGNSLFSMLVMDTFTDRIVAEYTGRPRTAKDAYEITLKLLLFYNAQANYENNLKGLFSYFDSKNALYLLCDTPQIIKDMELTKATNVYGNRSKGCNANARLNSWGRLLQVDWLLAKVNKEEGAEDKRLNIHRLRSIGYIEELIYWNPDGNFDRVSAAGMLFILREDRLKRTTTAKDNQYKRVNSLANDPYFNKNYKNGMGLDKLIK